MKKCLLVIISIITIQASHSQKSNSRKEGNYFKSSSAEYFDNVIKPWNYQYKANSLVTNNSNEIQKIGEILFWRTLSIADRKLNNWKPNIIYDIYKIEDIDTCSMLSLKIKEISPCDSLKKGGNILLIGRFVLLCPSLCINCISSENIDYCTNIVKKIFSYVNEQNTSDWNKILKELPIKSSVYIQ